MQNVLLSTVNFVQVDQNDWLNVIIGNCKTHQTASYTVLPLAINRHLNEGKGEGLGEWCQPTCKSKPSDFGRKVLSTTQAVMY